MNMKKTLLYTLIFTICTMGLWGCGNHHAQTSKPSSSIVYSSGAISNAGFEEGIDEYWQIDGAGRADGAGVAGSTSGSGNTDTNVTAVTINSSIAHNGMNSIKIGSADAYSAGVTQYVDGLTPGYYYLEAYTLNDGDQDYCYLYGKGTNQGKCMTAVPVTIHDNEWNKTTVRGIKVENDGILELGICSEGENQFLHVDSLSLHYEEDQSKPYEALFGGAISWLDWVEDSGGKYYYSDKTEGDALQIMAESGCNFVRLELYNNPGDYVNEYGDTFPKGYKDADSIYDLALRAHNKDMKIQLSFMYSDYWGNEAIPSDWQNAIKDINDREKIKEILAECIYDYTKAFMERLAATGIYPEYVSLGNEMHGGILLPYGATWAEDGDISAFCSFMDAGYRAVKEVSPDSKVVLHIASNADDMFWESKSGSGKWFFNLCEENNISYDVIGLSYYPYWAQTTDQWAVKKALNIGDLVEWCNMMIDTFDKDILVMESGINWGTPGQLANNGAYKGIYFYNPNDQRDFMYELINAIKSVKDGRCVGSLYWDPVLVRQEGIGYAINADTGTPKENVVETTTFFDYDHVALPVLDAYRYNVVGDSQSVLYGVVTDDTGFPVSDQTLFISYDNNTYSITTDAYGTYYTHIATTDQMTPGQIIKFDYTIRK